MKRERTSKVPIKIVQVSIDSLKSYPGNPRCWTEEQKGQVKQSLETYGFIDPVILSGSKRNRNTILGGNLRFECARELGYETIPAVYVNVPTIKLERELVLRLNKNTGSWDYDLLKVFGIEELLKAGFDDGDLSKIWDDALEAEDDDFDIEKELAAIDKPVSKLGDLWKLGRNLLMNADATKLANLKRLAGDVSADMFYSDPVYNLNV